MFSVNAASVMVLRTVCAGAGEVLRWRVAVKAHDIKVSLRFEPCSTSNIGGGGGSTGGDVSSTGGGGDVSSTGSTMEPVVISVMDKTVVGGSAEMCVQGEYTAPAPGVFEIELDNKHSMFRSKSVAVVVAVVPTATTPAAALLPR
jgi:hypothetical protein